MNGPKPKADVGRVLPQDLLTKTASILQQFGEVPMVQFASLFYSEYDIIFDAGSLGFSEGLPGYFKYLSDMVNVTPSDIGSMLSLKSQYYSCKNNRCNDENYNAIAISNNPNYDNPANFLNQWKATRREKGLLSPHESILWNGNFEHILKTSKKNVYIPESPFELAYKRNPYMFVQEARRIHTTLVQYPNGIPLNELYKIVPINKRVFNAPSIADIVAEYPELFYRTEPECEDGEPLVFDGLTNTFYDLSGADLESSFGIDPDAVVAKAIVSGLYQKSLILIQQSSEEGLKVGVWRQSMNLIFKPDQNNKWERNLMTLLPLHIFLSFSYHGLVNLKSHPESKNDLRVHFPSKAIDIQDILHKIQLRMRNKRKHSSSGSIDSSVTNNTPSIDDGISDTSL